MPGNKGRELLPKGELLPAMPLNTSIPMWKRHGVRIGVGAVCLISFAGWLAQNFFQLRGYVNLLASRIDLYLAAACLSLFMWVWARNVQRPRVVLPAVATAMIFALAGLLDWITIPATTTRSLVSRPVAEELGNLDKFLGSRDEYSLDELFAFEEMEKLNIRVTQDRINVYRRTHSEKFDLTQYGPLQLSVSLEIANVYTHGGGVAFTPNPNDVSLVLLPAKYTDNFALLNQFRDSGRLSQAIKGPVSDLCQEVGQNTTNMIDVFNNALHKNPDYFLRYDDPASPYWRQLDKVYFGGRFIPLKPKVDEITQLIQKELKAAP